jgi:hypothetical protein
VSDDKFNFSLPQTYKQKKLENKIMKKTISSLVFGKISAEFKCEIENVKIGGGGGAM